MGMMPSHRSAHLSCGSAPAQVRHPPCSHAEMPFTAQPWHGSQMARPSGESHGSEGSRCCASHADGHYVDARTVNVSATQFVIVEKGTTVTTFVQRTLSLPTSAGAPAPAGLKRFAGSVADTAAILGNSFAFAKAIQSADTPAARKAVLNRFLA